MKYYTRNKRKRMPRIFILIMIIIFILISSLIFYDKKIFPIVLEESRIVIKSKTTQMINETTLQLFNKEFNYNDIILIEKDKDNNINLIRANTVKLNSLTSELSIRCNKNLQQMGEALIEVPSGWFTNNSAFYNLGPKITVKLEPIGDMKTSYKSKFESAGINQTRHTIYLNVEATVRVIIPLHSEDIVVKCEIPVSETIIVGQIPTTAIELNK